ncbi:hypothetical protein ATZ36_12060 [Candidatus Endomicrobiellum trichonymphae]|uniref:PurM-like C-terminal domain-containing protein n=1 Tax=Endomicrobium trichonymphae TaxID=1408204 RepID=A0A1E5IP87_ENDTX|nr:hypothetical protein ATZ36_12060 [Candidatus Endomicrobium trichonymphae]
MSKSFDVPFISGKDSLHNEYSIGGKKYSIPPALLISAMGVIENAANTFTMPLKNDGDKVFVLGITRNELGGSVFAKINNIKDGIVPDVYPEESRDTMKKIYLAANENLIEACHDCSEGGLAVAISEMAFAAGKGVKIDIDAVKTGKIKSRETKLTVAEILFSESNGRFIVEVKPENKSRFREILENAVFAEIGCVSDDKKIVFESEKNKIKIQENLEVLLNCWRSTINW